MVVFEDKEYTDTKKVVLDKLPKPEGQAPSIISGNNASWDKSSNTGLTFISDAEYEDFIKVLVDDQEVDSKYYTVKEGSTVVTLKPEYLKTLSVGKHTFAIASKTGTATTEFTITDTTTSSVQTGDDNNIMLFTTLAILSMVGVVGIGIYGKKRA